MKQKVFFLLMLAALVAPFAVSQAQAANADGGGHQNPHPYLVDDWRYGRIGGDRYSSYYMISGGHGSGAT